MKYPVLLLSTIMFLNGCVASSAVNSIGARTTYGSASSSLNDTEQQFTIDLIDSEQNAESLFSLDLEPDTEGTKIANVSFYYNDIAWKTQDHIEGTIQLDVNGRYLKFDVARKGGEIKLTREYREPHGKALQSLLLISVPVDIAIDAAIIGVAIFAFAVLSSVNNSSSDDD
jgi:hypothetical protein